MWDVIVACGRVGIIRKFAMSFSCGWGKIDWLSLSLLIMQLYLSIYLCFLIKKTHESYTPLLQTFMFTFMEVANHSVSRHKFNQFPFLALLVRSVTVSRKRSGLSERCRNRTGNKKAHTSKDRSEGVLAQEMSHDHSIYDISVENYPYLSSDSLYLGLPQAPS